MDDNTSSVGAKQPQKQDRQNAQEASEANKATVANVRKNETDREKAKADFRPHR